MKPLAPLLVALAFTACALPFTGRRKTANLPALRTELRATDQASLRYGCLPRANDSTRFEIDIIVDSLRKPPGGSLTLVRGRRPPTRPGYVYQVVTVELQRAGQTRIFGTSCWHDAGIVVRGMESDLDNIRVDLDAPRTLLLRVIDGRGRSLSDSLRSTRQETFTRVTWTARR